MVSKQAVAAAVEEEVAAAAVEKLLDIETDSGKGERRQMRLRDNNGNYGGDLSVEILRRASSD